jgi:hypothetical protein
MFNRRKKAFNRQQKLMAKFASKQKAFMEQTQEDAVKDEGLLFFFNLKPFFV